MYTPQKKEEKVMPKRRREAASPACVSYRDEDCMPHAAIKDFFAKSAIAAAVDAPRPSLLPRFGMSLYNAVRDARCTRALLIGSVDGAAALYVGAALSENVAAAATVASDGVSAVPPALVSLVDPRLLVRDGDGGAARLAACDFKGIDVRVAAERHDAVALPALHRKGETFGFAHLDGVQLFDHAMVSFFFIDLMLDVGGSLVVENCDVGAMESLVSCIQTNYPHYRLVGCVAGADGGAEQQAVFTKASPDARKWNDHSAFGAGGGHRLEYKWIAVNGLPQEEAEAEAEAAGEAPPPGAAAGEGAANAPSV